MKLGRLARALDGLVERIERATALDGPAESIAAVTSRTLPAGPVRDIASGTPVAHPLHPALVAVPIGAWLGASYLDLTERARGERAAQALVGAGLIAALPAAITGTSDWLDTAGAERRVGLVHAALNWSAMTCYGASWLARRGGRPAWGRGFALAGLSLLGGAGWLGGHLAYALGVGVDTTAFQQLPDDWTSVVRTDELVVGRPKRFTVAGAPLLILRTDTDTDTGIVALADRCTHRGAPLDEGLLDGDCIECPWHGSRFDMRDGSVRRGPATRPQAVLEVRTRDGVVEVRRPGEQRSLRTNPVQA
jgi:nitrite reductase/ring-hydroxylating ferredoxin subunit/uncharacterized membrane protein